MLSEVSGKPLQKTVNLQKNYTKNPYPSIETKTEKTKSYNFFFTFHRWNFNVELFSELVYVNIDVFQRWKKAEGDVRKFKFSTIFFQNFTDM